MGHLHIQSTTKPPQDNQLVLEFPDIQELRNSDLAFNKWARNVQKELQEKFAQSK